MSVVALFTRIQCIRVHALAWYLPGSLPSVTTRNAERRMPGGAIPSRSFVGHATLYIPLVPF